MNRQLAAIVSIVFHPLFVPLYGVLMLLNTSLFYDHSLQFKLYVVAVIALFTCFIPMLVVFFMYKWKFISTLELPQRQQRYPVYIATILSYAGLVAFVPMISLIKLLCFSALIAIVLMAVINLFWKISIHTCAIGCFTGALFFVSYLQRSNPLVVMVIVILFSGLIASSRLQLKAHTLLQVVCGYVLGFFCSFLSSFFLLKIFLL